MATELQLRNSFLRAIRDITDGVKFNQLRDAIRNGNYEDALRAVDFDDAAFDAFRGQLLETYAQGGISAITGQRFPVPVRWNSATANTENYARNVVGADITRIADDARAAIRWTIGDGIALGRSRDRIALDIAGRIGPSGRREGGMIGLNMMQTRWVSNMRTYLDMGNLNGYLGLTKRDKRFDKLVRNSIKNGKPLTASQIDRIAKGYTDKLLLSRALIIARTERGLAINQGAIEAWRQAAARLRIPESVLEKKWLHTGRSRIDRPTHMAASGQTVRGLDTPFEVSGLQMQCPHDPNAPASEVICCECLVKISLPKNWRSYVIG